MNSTPQNTPFKQTEIGLIPQDWEVKKLGEVIINVEYGSSAKSKPEGKVPVLRMGNIQNGKIDWTDLVYTEDDNEIKKYLLKKDDVLFNRTNTVDLVGKTGIYRGESPAIFAGYLIRINRKEDLIDADYLTYLLNTKYAKNYGYLVLSVAVGQANINGAKLKTYPIPLPPTKAEQTAIATALSDADALIGGLEKLIHKKRLLKQATMQHLLTPKEDWVVKKLGEIAEIDPENLNSSTKPDYTFHYISLEDVDCGTLRNTTEMQFMNAPSRARRKLRKNDILVSTVRPNLKSHLHIKTEVKDWICSTGFCILRCNEDYINSSFVFNHFFDSSINSQIDNLITGSNYPAINSRDVKNLAISFPPLAEQTRIATILSDMDAELSGLEVKLEKYRQLKQGMMQQLLTGKIRLM